MANQTEDFNLQSLQEFIDAYRSKYKVTGRTFTAPLLSVPENASLNVLDNAIKKIYEEANKIAYAIPESNLKFQSVFDYTLQTMKADSDLKKYLTQVKDSIEKKSKPQLRSELDLKNILNVIEEMQSGATVESRTNAYIEFMKIRYAAVESNIKEMMDMVSFAAKQADGKYAKFLAEVSRHLAGISNQISVSVTKNTTARVRTLQNAEQILNPLFQIISTLGGEFYPSLQGLDPLIGMSRVTSQVDNQLNWQRGEGMCTGLVLDWTKDGQSAGAWRSTILEVTPTAMQNQRKEALAQEREVFSPLPHQCHQQVQKLLQELPNNFSVVIGLKNKLYGHGHVIGIRKALQASTHKQTIEIFDPNYGSAYFSNINAAVDYLTLSLDIYYRSKLKDYRLYKDQLVKFPDSIKIPFNKNFKEVNEHALKLEPGKILDIIKQQAENINQELKGKHADLREVFMETIQVFAKYLNNRDEINNIIAFVTLDKKCQFLQNEETIKKCIEPLNARLKELDAATAPKNKLSP